MRKFICTFTVFCIVLGLLWVSVAVKVPGTVWWDQEGNILFRDSKPVPLIIWIIPNAFPPALLLAFSFFIWTAINCGAPNEENRKEQMTDLELAILMIQDLSGQLGEDCPDAEYSRDAVLASLRRLQNSVAEIPSLSDDTRKSVIETLQDSLRIQRKTS